MRLVLSRKGFDASWGGVPSPILPDGTLRPLPIPYAAGSRTFADLGGPAPRAAELLADLAPRRRTPWGAPLGASTPAHLDPDLDRRTLPRPRGWRPAFGQTGAAQTHLAARGVGPGDLFLFFGWFREVSRAAGRWRYAPGAPDLHVIFGWLQVGDVRPARPGLPAPAWLRTHEHVRADLGPSSTVYLAADALTLGAQPVRDVPSAGVVRTLRAPLVLTAPGASRSEWRLPASFAPPSGALTYHDHPGRWRPDGPDHVRLRSAPIGQEFVLGGNDTAVTWARTLLTPERRNGAAA
ncbi:hypothetical protein tb265_29490 [Gemmatimonadetes bacterium T265]|nr:hypothetical protein tb265_29490 [Gemmatimonadetes bacterium T265]